MRSSQDKYTQKQTDTASLNIRITEHQHVSFAEFITDCMVIAQMHNNDNFRSKLNSDSIETSIIGMSYILDLLSPQKSTKHFLLSFYNEFLHFFSILTQIFDEKIVSTKLRIRGPYLLMINDECMQKLFHFLLSQIILIQSSMNINDNDSNCIFYEMTLKQMKNLRYLINLLKNLLQFELYTFDFLQMNKLSNIVLFDSETAWSKALSKLFGAMLMIKLPTNSVGVLAKFSVDKLCLLEDKAIATTKAFRSFIIGFVRFLIVHYHQTILEQQQHEFNHLDVLMNQIFDLKHNKHNQEEIMSELWNMEKLKSEYGTEYEIRAKYASSAFLKGITKKEDGEEEGDDNDNEDIDIVQVTPSKKSKKRKRNQMKFDIVNKSHNEEKYELFIKEQCYLLTMDKILAFCMDFDGFFEVLVAKKFEIYEQLMQTMNVILIHFIQNEKWWNLSHVMTILNDLFEHPLIFKQFVHSLKQKDESKDIALNAKYGIYSFMIWICYLHQYTPKPIICFFDEDFDPKQALKQSVDNDAGAKRQKLIKASNEKDAQIFETLESVQQRLTELCIAKSIFIKLLITMVCV